MRIPSSLRLILPGVIATLAGTGTAIGGSPFPAVLDLAGLDGANGFVLKGIDSQDRCGASASWAGDVNGDSIDDIILGAYIAAPHGWSQAGESYVVFGGSGIGASGSMDLSALDGTNGFVVNGADRTDRSGISVASAGDINGDGVGDIIVGALLAGPGGRQQAGQCYVVFGGPLVGADGFVEPASLTGANGFVINGVESDDASGCSVASAGDVNDDGFDDIIIGAQRADPAGAAYVVFGGAGVGSSGSLELSSLDGADGFVLTGIGHSTHSSWVAGASDVNGDGIDDLAIGASQASPGGRFRAGACYIVFGGAALGSSGSLDVSSLNGVTGFAVNGIDQSDAAGFSVSLCDLNADSVADILIGAPNANPQGKSIAGESYVVFGGSGVGTTGSVELSSLNGTNGFALYGVDQGDHAGVSVSSGRDLNGDGLNDLIVGAHGASSPGRTSAGETYVVFGGAGLGSTGTIHLSALDGANGFVLRGMDGADFSGRTVSAAGDVNSDGVDDILIGAKFAYPIGTSDTGEVYVVFGRRCPGDVNIDQRVSAADFNILASNFRQTVPAGTLGDLTGDGTVSASDFNILAANFRCGAE